MTLLPFLAAAALAPLAAPVEADMRCTVAMLYATGTASEAKDDTKVSAFSAATAYFTGKLEVKAPGLDLAGHIERIASDNAFLGQIDKEVQRCSLEAGKAMQRIGRSAAGA